jgi:hypothetical protein
MASEQNKPIIKPPPQENCKLEKEDFHDLLLRVFVGNFCRKFPRLTQDPISVAFCPKRSTLIGLVALDKSHPLNFV